MMARTIGEKVQERTASPAESEATSLPRVITVRTGIAAARKGEQFTGTTCELITVRSTDAAFELLASESSAAIVIADLGSGIHSSIDFLREVRTRHPATIRILLCEDREPLRAAAAAVNAAGVFRILVKPYDNRALVVAVEEGLRIRRRSQADRTLLQTTLMASVNMLAEVLAISAPRAYQRASFARACVSWAVKQLHWADMWIYEIAAALSQIGRVTLQADAESGKMHAEVAHDLVKAIPNLESSAAMIRYQTMEAPQEAGEEVCRGAALLRAALLMEELIENGVAANEVAPTIKRMAPGLPYDIVTLVARFRVDLGDQLAFTANELRAGFIVEHDVTTTDGTLVLSKNHVLSDAVLTSLRRLSEQGALNEPIWARAPANEQAATG